MCSVYSVEDVLEYVKDALELLVLEEADQPLGISTSMSMAISVEGS